MRNAKQRQHFIDMYNNLCTVLHTNLYRKIAQNNLFSLKAWRDLFKIRNTSELSNIFEYAISSHYIFFNYLFMIESNRNASKIGKRLVGYKYQLPVVISWWISGTTFFLYCMCRPMSKMSVPSLSHPRFYSV